MNFPASVIFIEHPKYGRLLFDTGYSARFYEATSKFPEKLYALITPISFRKEDTVVHQLAQRGIAAESINYVILSHFHADHIGGLGDFPRAEFIFIDQAYKDVMSYGRFKALRKGFLKDLLPENFAKRARSLDSSHGKKILNGLPHFQQFDIFGDGSLIGVALPGHAAGHMGLWFESGGETLFFIADACWLSRQFEENLGPTPIASLILDDSAAYRSTIGALHKLYKESPQLKIFPCHCARTLTHIDI